MPTVTGMGSKCNVGDAVLVFTYTANSHNFYLRVPMNANETRRWESDCLDRYSPIYMKIWAILAYSILPAVCSM